MSNHIDFYFFFQAEDGIRDFHVTGVQTCALLISMLQWWGPIIHEYYSGSESIGMCAIGPEEWMRHQGSVGKAVRGELHILAEDGSELPPRQTGLVFFANGGELKYHNDPAKTARAHNEK